MAPRRPASQIAPKTRAKRAPAAGKAKASPKSKGRKPAAKTPAPKTPVPKTPLPMIEKKKGGAVPSTPATFHDVQAEVLLRSSYATKEAQLHEALRKAQDLEAVARAERSRALEAEKRAAAAEAYLQELRERASRAEALQLEVGQAQARAAHAEAKAEVLSELQESFQRNIPDMVRSIAQTMVDCSNRRRNPRSLDSRTPSFRGVKPKLELEDGAPEMPHLMVGVSEDDRRCGQSDDRSRRFYGGATEEIPSSADTKSDSQDRGRSQARLPYGLPCVLKGAVRSG
eukprot:symbB.v1.2.007150.t1/scaffold435.1/size205859/25